jgi:hypothetical protein
MWVRGGLCVGEGGLILRVWEGSVWVKGGLSMGEGGLSLGDRGELVVGERRAVCLGLRIAGCG